MNKFIFTLFLFLFFNAQAKNSLRDDKEEIKKYLTKKSFTVDPNADAVYLNSSGRLTASYSERKFYYELEVEKLVKVINEKGMDILSVNLELEPNQNISDVEVVTYNLATKGQVSEAESKEPLETKVTTSGKEVKLNFPSARPGSVVYYKYKLKSSGSLMIPAWYVQEKYPTLHNQLLVNNEYGTEFAVFSNIGKDFKEVSASDLISCKACFNVSSNRNDLMQFKSAVWARNSIPGQPYVANCAVGTRELLRVQLRSLMNNKYYMAANNNSTYSSQDRRPEYLKDLNLVTWTEVNENLLYGGKDLGKILEGEKGILQRTVTQLIQGESSSIVKVKKIFTYVRDNIQLLPGGTIFADSRLKKVLAEKKGTAVEKNLLLTALLQEAGIKAFPVLLVAGKDESLMIDFPNYTALNYCIVGFIEGKTQYFIDAAPQMMPFGLLKADCYSRTAFQVSRDGAFVQIPSAPKERDIKMLQIDVPGEGVPSPLSFQATLSPLSAFEFRNAAKASKVTSTESDLSAFVGSYFGLKPGLITSCSLKHLSDVDSVLTISAKGAYKPEEVVGSFDPFVVKLFNKPNLLPIGNKAEREEVYLLAMNLPANYEVKNWPAKQQLMLGNSILAYMSNAQFDASQHLFKLTYTFRQSGEDIEAPLSDLNSFVEHIRKSQLEPMLIGK